jgi:hypothetical protein
MDRRLILLCAGAIPLGLAGGYAWSSATAPAQRAAKPPKAIIADVPASPEEKPVAEDRDWSARAQDEPAQAAAAGGSPTVRASVYYSGCNEVRAAGRAPLYRGDPGYRPEMDGDSDGIACEPIRRN